MHSPRRTFLITGLAAACAPRAPDLQTVLARHTEARGGAAALDAVRSVRTDITLTEPSFVVNGRYIARSDGRMRVDIFADETCVFSEGVDSAGAWAWTPGGAPQPASPAGEAALRHGVEFNLFGLHRLPARGHMLTLEGGEEVAGAFHHVIKIVLEDGFETYRYIDPESWMIVRARDVRAFHPDVDATEAHVESVYSDFRDVSGVRNPFAWRQRNLLNGEELQQGRVRAMQYNAVLEEADFDRGRRA